jgi:outer membrane lipoprotein-sorting protein
MIAVNYLSGEEGMRGMRRSLWIVALVVGLTLVLAGCGNKNAGTIVKDLDQVVTKMDSYQGSGRMTIQTGQEPQEYQVEVWYKSPHYYRIALTNPKKDISQIVLRNDEGVFVLTPHLNKSFRFQSDWPEKQGQVYLYQSLVQSIIADKERQFTTDNGAYVFDVAANYPNASNLARQRIWLNKKNYAPQHVEVSDANANVRVIVDFSKFVFGNKFDKDSFDMKRNMSAWNLNTLPSVKLDDTLKNNGAAATTDNVDKAKTDATKTTAGDAANANATKTDAGKTDAGKTDAANTNATKTDAIKMDAGKTGAGKTDATKTDAANANATKTDATKTGTSAKDTSNKAAVKADPTEAQLAFGIIEPGYKPEGVKQQDISEVKLSGAKAILMRYTGTYHYSIVESKPLAQEALASALTGEIVDLGFTLAVLTGEDKKTLEWNYNGVDFRLSSGDLPKDEMIKVAMAVDGQSGK